MNMQKILCIFISVLFVYYFLVKIGLLELL